MRFVDLSFDEVNAIEEAIRCTGYEPRLAKLLRDV